jgi:hypothetical protein
MRSRLARLAVCICALLALFEAGCQHQVASIPSDTRTDQRQGGEGGGGY